MSSTFRERFWTMVCGVEQALRLLFVLMAAFSVLTLISLFTVDPGTGTYLIVLFNLAVFVPTLLVVGILLQRCRSRRIEELESIGLL